MKKFAALGLIAALAFAPVASFAQTDAPATAATPSASEASKSPVAKMQKHRAMRHNYHKAMAKKMKMKMKMKKMAPAATETPKS